MQSISGGGEGRYYRPGVFGGFSFFPPVIKALLIINGLMWLFFGVFLPAFTFQNVPIFVIFREYLSAGFVAFMMLFGKILEDFTAERAKTALGDLGRQALLALEPPVVRRAVHREGRAAAGALRQPGKPATARIGAQQRADPIGPERPQLRTA